MVLCRYTWKIFDIQYLKKWLKYMETKVLMSQNLIHLSDLLIQLDWVAKLVTCRCKLVYVGAKTKFHGKLPCC